LVNYEGPKNCFENFLSIRDTNLFKVVNVGSGIGPSFVHGMTKNKDDKLVIINPQSQDEITKLSKKEPKDVATGTMGANTGMYGFSKALLMSYTILIANDHKDKNVAAYSLSPGFIDTPMTRGFGAKLKPEEGTVSIRHCLKNLGMAESGWFYGSDAKKSPMHEPRDPGTDGSEVWVASQQDYSKIVDTLKE
jgi:carbonyl reductase 1